jgi:hypothetical protein
LSSKQPVIRDAAIVEPPLANHDTQPQGDSHLRALYMHNLGILTFNCTHTKLWNQAHNRRRLSPFQNKLTLSQKCRPSGRKSGEFFCEEEDDAWAAGVCGYTMQGNLFSLLQAESEGITWKSYMWNLPCGVLKFSLHASIDTLPTFNNLKRLGKRASVNCHLCGNTVKHFFPCSCSL